MLDKDMHRRIAIECNNHSWRFIQKDSLSVPEADEAVHMIHTSAWHWSRVGEPINMVRACYMIAKVYFAVGRIDEACYWSESCWHKTEELAAKNWDLVFGLEIIARRHAARGEEAKMQDCKQRFIDERSRLEEGDKKLCQTEWNRGPWFGLDSSS